MKTVEIGELEANLSANLRLVSDGEEVLICDHDKPIAKIVPIAMNDFGYSDRMQRLIAKGAIKPRQRSAGQPNYVPTPVVPGKPIPKEFIDAFWEEERADRV